MKKKKSFKNLIITILLSFLQNMGKDSKTQAKGAKGGDKGGKGADKGGKGGAKGGDKKEAKGGKEEKGGGSSMVSLRHIFSVVIVIGIILLYVIINIITFFFAKVSVRHILCEKESKCLEALAKLEAGEKFNQV